MITNNDNAILRELAQKQKDVAELPVMAERTALWYEHNDLKGKRPMVHFEVDTFEHEIMAPLECESEAGNKIEHQLRRILLITNLSEMTALYLIISK